MAYNSFPYTNYHELNLDYLLNKAKEVQGKVDESAANVQRAKAEADRSTAQADASAASARNSQISATQSAGSAAQSAGSAAQSAESARIAAAAAGDPKTFTAAAQLTDTSKIYVYIGTTGTYTYGHWYYYAGGAWIDGGVYGTWTTDDALDPDSTNAVQNKVIYGAVNELKSDLHQTETRNLFNPFASHYISANTSVSVNGNDVTITSINNAANYKYAEWFIDVRGKDSITLSFSEASGTGDMYVRLASSPDGVTHGEWISQTTTSPKSFYVSSYDYIGIALYAVLAANHGIGNFITYKNLMVEYGKNFTDYIPALIVNDQTARETAVYAKNQIDAIANFDSLNLFDSAVWEIGGIDGNGNNSSVTNRIRTANYIPLPATIDTINVDVDSGYLYGFYLYDSDFNKIFATTIFYAVSNKYSVPDNAVYCRAIIRNSENADADLSWKTHLHCFGASKLQNEVLNLIGGTGSNVYVGDEVNLATPKRSHNCNISLWLDVNSTDFPEVETYRVFQNQSIAIYAGYVFVFFGNGGGIAIDFETKTIINGFTSEPVGHNHQNCAQFTDIFYDTNDEFPLIIISRCGNSSPNDPQTEYDTCLIYRITRSGTEFTFTLINTIACDVASYGNDWVYDSVNRTISMLTPKNATYNVSVNNPILFSTWVMPDAESILSGAQITLFAKDRIGVAECENVVMQAACAFGTDIFFGAQDGTTTRYVYVMDMSNGIVKTKIPLVNSHELEGVTIYDGKLYVAHRNGSSLSETEPLQIYEIVF